MNNEIKKYIDSYINKSFKTGSHFPNNEKYIKNGFHSITLMNEISRKFNIPFNQINLNKLHSYLLNR